MPYVSPRRGGSGYVSPRVAAGTRPKRKKGGPSLGGFLGNIGGGLRDLAVASGPGLFEAGRALYGDVTSDLFSFKPRYRPIEETETYRRVLRPAGQDFATRYGPLVRGDLGEFAHQLYEKPVPFAIDIGVVASLGAGTAARGAAVGRAARTGGSVGKALRHGPPPELRRVKVPVPGKGEAEALLGTYSRSTLTRQTQKFLDGIRQRFPDAPILGRSLYRKVGFQQVRLGQIEERLGRIGAEELLSVAGGRKLNAAQHRALRVVGEGVPLNERLARHAKDLEAASSAKQARRLRGEIRLLEKTRKYLDESGAKIVDPKLAAIYDLAKQSTKRREDLLALVDELAPERAARRIQQPADVFAGIAGSDPTRRIGDLERWLDVRVNAVYAYLREAAPSPTVGRDTRPRRQMRPEDFAKTQAIGEGAYIDPSDLKVIRPQEGKAATRARAEETLYGLGKKEDANPLLREIAEKMDELAELRAGLLARQEAGMFGRPYEGETFFTYSSRKRPTSLARLGASRTIRHARSPVGKAFTGEAIKQGRIPRAEAILAAEAELEAWRFTTILRNRERLEQFGKPLPTRGNDVALVLDDLKGKTLPEEVRALLNKAGAGATLAEDELTVIARISEGLRKEIFPGKWNDLKHDERFVQAASEPISGIVWIDKRLLGGLEAPNPLIGFSGNVAAQGALSVVDTINNAQKAAILYLLPLKYISPNLISQVGFALIQQGFAAPVNLGRAARLNAKLGRRATLAIDAGMGEGFAASIAGHTTGPLTRFNRAAARWYGKVIDVPFRRASFLHEAMRAGHETPAQINKLLFDPVLRERRLATFLEANSEIIDYSRLGRIEQNIIRRLVFFYPWVKGATVYGGRFAVEHPAKLWALDQLGKIGSEAQGEILGFELPSYGEALAPFGTSGGLPTTLNLAAVSPFTTPYQSLRALTGDRRAAYSLGSQFSPAITAALMAAGFTSPGGYEAGPGAALRELYEGLPQYRYPKRAIEGPPERAVYPTTTWQDIMSLIFGTGVTPRRTDPKRLAEEARRGR